MKITAAKYFRQTLDLRNDPSKLDEIMAIGSKSYAVTKEKGKKRITHFLKFLNENGEIDFLTDYLVLVDSENSYKTYPRIADKITALNNSNDSNNIGENNDCNEPHNIEENNTYDDPRSDCKNIDTSISDNKIDIFNRIMILKDEIKASEASLKSLKSEHEELKNILLEWI